MICKPLALHIGSSWTVGPANPVGVIAELIWLVALMGRYPLWHSKSGGGSVETRITSASTRDPPRPPKLTASLAFARCLCTGVTAG
jgi:hypothetical protein